MTEQPYMTTRDVARLLSRSEASVRNLVMRRAIPYRKPGGRLLFLRHEVETWVERADGVRLEEIQ